MTEQKVIHILRNPYAHSEDEIITAGREAASLIEKYKDAYINMREFAESNGLDTVTHG